MLVLTLTPLCLAHSLCCAQWHAALPLNNVYAAVSQPFCADESTNPPCVARKGANAPAGTYLFLGKMQTTQECLVASSGPPVLPNGNHNGLVTCHACT